MQAELIVDARNAVGESPVWDGRRQRLYWVDGVSRLIRAHDMEERRKCTFLIS